MRNQLEELFAVGNAFPADGDRRRYGPIAAIGQAALKGLGGIASGVIGAKAAKSAAAAQEDSDLQAANLVTKTAADVNPQITQAASAAGEGATQAASAAGAGATAAAGSANALLQPYIAAGGQTTQQLQQYLQQGGALNHTITADNFETQDPGYAFRLQQAQQAMTNKAAAGGGALGGNAALAMNRYKIGKHV